MMTEMNVRSDTASIMADGASGPTLLTDDEIAAVSGSYLPKERPYFIMGAGAVMGWAGYVLGASALSAIAVTGVVATTAGIALVAAPVIIVGGIGVAIYGMTQITTNM
jgi:hypothetical protein